MVEREASARRICSSQGLNGDPGACVDSRLCARAQGLTTSTPDSASPPVFALEAVAPALAAVLTVLPHSGGNEHFMHVAIGTSLGTIFFTSLRSVQAHAKRGAVDWNILKGWLPWVVAGVIAGVVLTSFMDGDQLKIAFGVALVPLGRNFIFQLLGRKVKGEENMPKGPARAALGSGLGAFSSLLGIGGGTPAILIMTLSGVNMHRAVATAAGFGHQESFGLISLSRTARSHGSYPGQIPVADRGELVEAAGCKRTVGPAVCGRPYAGGARG